MRACGRGICAANEGHEGTCDEASGWAEEPISGATWSAIQQIKRAVRGDAEPLLWDGDQA